jgi:hypothetical protein
MLVQLAEGRHVGLHLDWTSGVASAVHGNEQLYMLVASMPLAWRVAILNSAGYMPFVPAILVSTHLHQDHTGPQFPQLAQGHR